MSCYCELENGEIHFVAIGLKQIKAKNMLNRFFSSCIFEFNNMQNQRGFLPSINPSVLLPETCLLHILLNKIIQNLPELLQKKQLRFEIDKLNHIYQNSLLDFTSFDSNAIRVATLILTMLAQAYVWENMSSPATKIPRIISANLFLLCEKQQHRLPMLTYQDYILHNWRLINPDKEITLGNIEPLFTFTGSKDEAWFISIHVAIEKICGEALYAAFQALHCTNSGKIESLSQLLKNIVHALSEATQTLQKMKERCNPDYFYNIIRLYLKGWETIKSIHNDKEVTGVSFDLESNGEETVYHDFRGTSGAQSSILPSLDVLMGVKHQTEPVLQIFKEYMPWEHQLFISFMQRSKLKEFVMASKCDHLIKDFENVIQSISLFRNQHFALVKNFLIKPASQLGIEPHSIIGTGNTRVDDYLEKRIQQTHCVITEINQTDHKSTGLAGIRAKL